MKSFVFTLFLFTLCIEYRETSKILYMVPFSGVSHRILFKSVTQELANRGHEVTVISPQLSQPHPKVKNIFIEDNKFNAGIHDVSDLFKKLIGSHAIPLLVNLEYSIKETCIKYFNNSQVQELLKVGKQFDLVVVSTLLCDCAIATAPLLGKQFILHSVTSLAGWTWWFTPTSPSFIPNLYLPYTDEMNFLQRLDNWISNMFMRLYYDYYLIPIIQGHVDANVPNAPSLYDVTKQASFLLINNDPVFQTQRPFMPNMAFVGGMHYGNTKLLPKELEDFIQSSTSGVILFSLGTNFPSSFLSLEKVNSILSVFGQLKQNVIWKYEKELKNCPPNVKISKWLPQEDILAHPKTRLFITHGGLLSLEEAIYHGVPVVAIPIFADQPSNVARVTQLEIGVKIDFNNVTHQSIFDAVTTVLTDKRFATNIKKYSNILKKQIETPLEREIYWVEYVIRHYGAAHLRSHGEELNFFQYYLLDVIGFLSAIILFVVFLIWLSIKFILNKISRNKSKHYKSKKKM